jgi:hypothetical protein
MNKTLSMLVLVGVAAIGCGEAKEKAAEARDKLAEGKDKLDELKKKADVLKADVTMKAFDAAGTALKAKAELDKIYKSTSDYDLKISSEDADDASMAAHNEKIAKMPNVSLGDFTVGYEEDQNRSIDGQTFSRHFRATWAVKGKKVAISYYTKQEIDLAAFGDLVKKLAPIVQAQIGG